MLVNYFPFNNDVFIMFPLLLISANKSHQEKGRKIIRGRKEKQLKKKKMLDP